MEKLQILLLAIYGELLKMLCRLKLVRIPHGVNTSEKRAEKIIISLTSYGRRVSTVLPFTIISLLRQTYKPDMVLLWLDSDHWNDEKLPEKLKKLQNNGLTIKYCKDIKSYKKLIPALELYPNDIIVTCDDDIYYRCTMLERLILEYYKDPTHVYSHRAHMVGLTSNGKLRPYNDWEEEISGISGALVFPTGGSGCLYKKSLLYKDVCNEDLFMKLAPKADDVWFYFMEILQQTTCVVLANDGYIYIPLDAFYQHFHKGSSLYSSNCLESQNDIQIEAVMKYYGIDMKELIK